MNKIDWSKQHCGVHQADFYELIELMPDLKELLRTFPENPLDFTWDVKVHMLMPGQYPCIPNWHYDMVPRTGGIEDFNKCQDKPMWLWLSGSPLTQFRKDKEITVIKPETWHRFTQADEHRGVAAEEFCWRGLIRATHNDLRITDKSVNNPFGKHSSLRRHCQVYLDADNFKW